MIRLKEIIEELGLEVFSGEGLLESTVTGAYASDLLSDVMGKSAVGNVWVTMQTHRNIVAVAALKEHAAILVVNGGKPDEETLETAAREGVAILGTHESAFVTCGKMYIRLERDALV
jgi:predicted transcriptional regulator